MARSRETTGRPGHATRTCAQPSARPVVSATPSGTVTSVDQAGHGMGSDAVRLLVERAGRVDGRRKHAVQTTMTPRLVIRRSSAAPHP
ncbi:hypothetical protein [Streptomyces sp. NPDC086777]|uniref:hypothetical protein n=1 Tax=Streptomyces sp. NPDC086777 TaxID=3154866 RepID=UPI00345064AD